MATVNQNPQSSLPSSTSVSKVRRETIEKAVKALLKWKQTQPTSQNPQLLSHQEDFIYLILSLKKIPSRNKTSPTKPHKIPLPHPLFLPDSSSELCLIIDDRPSSKLTGEIARKKIQSEELPITKVLRMSKLRSDYNSFEDKRKLCDSYELFFADKRIIHLLPKVLGKQFFKKKKLPLPMDLSHNNWKEQIERACASALLNFKTGTCTAVRVGEAAMVKEEIFDNVGAAIDGVIELVPKKWKGVRSLHLKFSESVPLPLYQALPDSKLKIEGTNSLRDGGEGKKIKI